MQYSELQCSEAIHKAVERMGFAEMTEIQEKTIPVMLAGRDVIAKAPTGTGKTFAFGIPIIEHIEPGSEETEAVILAPTRELAMQITAELRDLCVYLPGVRIVCLYGGAPIGKQIDGQVIGSGDDFAKLLLEKSLVAVVPGSGFGAPNFVRLSYAISTENIETGMDRLEAFLNRLQ